MNATSAGELSFNSREYIFVIMPYHDENGNREHYDYVYEQIKDLIAEHVGLRCVRADHLPEPGRGLLEKVHQMILGATVVVADLSEHSPNVYYEYGYASAHDRRPILIGREGKNPPTDLAGVETLIYKGSPRGDAKFSQDFIECINRLLNSPLPEQRRMLTGPNPFPCAVLAAPRVPEKGSSKHWWHPDERHTFGDMVGILGILTAYGNLFGTHRLPELLNGYCAPSDVFEQPANFFCIGSSKLNKGTEYFLPRMQKGLQPHWVMKLVGLGRDKRVILQGEPELEGELAAPIVRKKPNGDVQDYGLIVRGPNPIHPEHLILVAAGRHSIGTHAACSMIVRPMLIKALEEELKKQQVFLRDIAQPFWAVVKGTLKGNGILSDDVEIIRVGGYRPG